jgi:FKBP-type peptidyl-prolyl cis-trans isomerase
VNKVITMTCMAALAWVTAGAANAQETAPAPAPAQDIGPVQAGDLTLETNLDKASYAIGLDIARNFKRADIELNLEALVQGFRDVASGADLALTDEQVGQVMMEFNQTIMAQMQQAQERASEESRVQGAAFLAEKEQEAGVQKTASGLLYEVVDEGSGKSPTAADTVRVHYTGTLIDGTQFDSSHQRGRPAEFPVGRVIPGWTEALQLMKEGAHWKLYIPSNLGYGPDGNPQGGIPGNAVLVFDVQLLDVLDRSSQVTIPQTPNAQ